MFSSAVALRKESVDRNIKEDVSYNIKETSLSARRAWIEIAQGWRISGCTLSLSARRAWIEILVAITPSNFSNVALRKESVDRNGSSLSMSCSAGKSLSARRAWIEIMGLDGRFKL